MQLEPSKSYGSWSGAEVEAFLSEARMPMRLSLSSRNGLLIVPLWFEYQLGRLLSCSPDDSFLVSALRAKPEVAFDISTNELPYRGVRGRGMARCTAASDNQALERLLLRYLGGVESPLAQWLLDRPGDEALIELEISWLTSWDFSGRMEGIRTISDRLPDAVL